LLLESATYNLNALEYVAHGHGVFACKLSKHLGGDSTSLILNKVQGVCHVLNSSLAMNTNGKHTQGGGLETIVEAEGGSHLVFHVERNWFQPAHVEERLVLDFS
jgi:hypothetical protein